VTALAGARYAHDDGTPGVARWGHQRGSIYLADQKVPIAVPRVRDLHAGTELPLATYTQRQMPRAQDVGLFRCVLAGVSTREYRAATEAVPEAFGIAKSSVSRRFIRASADALRHFHTRRHDDREWLVLLLDGKTFADDQVVIALGVRTDGEKRVLGLVQTATENKQSCATVVRELVERGFTAPKGLLVVLDGAKGLRSAVRDVFGEDVAVQRCQWHKRENVLSYLPKAKHTEWRRKRRMRTPRTPTPSTRCNDWCGSSGRSMNPRRAVWKRGSRKRSRCIAWRCTPTCGEVSAPRI